MIAYIHQAVVHWILNRLCEGETLLGIYDEWRQSDPILSVAVFMSNEARDQNILENSSLACGIDSKQPSSNLDSPHNMTLCVRKTLHIDSWAQLPCLKD